MSVNFLFSFVSNHKHTVYITVYHTRKQWKNKILTGIKIIIWCKFFFLFIGREPTTWPANNCLKIMACSCAMSSNCGLSVWLQIMFCACVNETTLFSISQSLLRKNGKHKISWCVSVSQINYLPQPSALAKYMICLRQLIMIFCSTSSNNIIVNKLQH